MGKQIEVLLNSLSPQAVEAIASQAHEAYLQTCQRVGREIPLDDKVPYEQLGENSKEVNRSIVRAVVAFFIREVRESLDRQLEAERLWGESIKLAEYYKSCVQSYGLRLKTIREELDKRGVSRCAACKGEGGRLAEDTDPEEGILAASHASCPVCRGTGMAPSLADPPPSSPSSSSP